jgi:hypothetical protein
VFNYQWEQCDSTGASCESITNAIKSSYKLAAADTGRDVTVVVTATDQEGQTGQAVATPVGPVTAYVNWPGYLFDPGHSSLNGPATAITPTQASQPTAAWSAPFKPTGGLYASPTVYDGVVYIGGRNGLFYELDESTGVVLHSANLGVEQACSTAANPWGIASTATVAPDPTRGGAPTVYVTAGSPAGGAGGIYLWALDATDLHPVWTTDPVAVDQQAGSYAWSSPTVSAGEISVGISSACDSPLVRGGLAFFNQSDGTPAGTYYTVPAGSVGGGVWSTAAASGSTSWVTTGNADPTSGATAGDSFSIVRLSGPSKVDIWTVPAQNGTDNDWGSSPTLFKGIVGGVSTPLVGACLKSGTFYALESSSLSSGPVWSFEIADPTDTLSCLSAGVWDSTAKQLIVGGNRTASPIDGQQWPGSVRALSPDATVSNRVIWEQGLPCAVQGTPTENGAGVLAVVTWNECSSGNSPSLYLFNARSSLANPNGNPNPVLLKTIRLSSSAFSQPTFADNYLFVASNSGGLMAYH